MLDLFKSQFDKLLLFGAFAAGGCAYLWLVYVHADASDKQLVGQAALGALTALIALSRGRVVNGSGNNGGNGNGSATPPADEQ